jgi:hypothetical protein
VYVFNENHLLGLYDVLYNIEWIGRVEVMICEGINYQNVIFRSWILNLSF